MSNTSSRHNHYHHHNHYQHHPHHHHHDHHHPEVQDKANESAVAATVGISRLHINHSLIVSCPSCHRKNITIIDHYHRNYENHQIYYNYCHHDHHLYPQCSSSRYDSFHQLDNVTRKCVRVKRSPTSIQRESLEIVGNLPPINSK